MIFRASLSGSDDFVVFDSSDGNDTYLNCLVKFTTLDGNPASVSFKKELN